MPDLQRPLGLEGLGGEEHLPRHPRPHQVEEVEDPAAVVGHAQLGRGDGEGGGLAADGQVADRGQVAGPAPDAPLHHGDDRRREVLDLPDDVLEGVGVVERVLARLGQALHVQSGRPDPGAGAGAQHHGAHLPLGEGHETGGDVGEHLRGEAVAPSRIVERQDPDPVRGSRTWRRACASSVGHPIHIGAGGPAGGTMGVGAPVSTREGIRPAVWRGRGACSDRGSPWRSSCTPRPDRTDRFPLALLAVAWLALSTAACSSASGPAPLGDIPDPVFNDPVAKIALTGDLESFSRTLYDQYVYQDTGLVDSAVDVEIYMTFFGGPNNRGRALAFLDTTNYLGTPGPGRDGGQGHLDHGERRLAVRGLPAGQRVGALDGPGQAGERQGRRARRQPGQAPRPGLHGSLPGRLRAECRRSGPTTRPRTPRWRSSSTGAAGPCARGPSPRARASGAPSGPSAARSTSWWPDGHVADFKCAARDFPGYREPADWVDCPADCRPAP